MQCGGAGVQQHSDASRISYKCEGCGRFWTARRGGVSLTADALRVAAPAIADGILEHVGGVWEQIKGTKFSGSGPHIGNPMRSGCDMPKHIQQQILGWYTARFKRGSEFTAALNFPIPMCKAPWDAKYLYEFKRKYGHTNWDPSTVVTQDEFFRVLSDPERKAIR